MEGQREKETKNKREVKGNGRGRDSEGSEII